MAMKNNAGFTLIELMITIVISGFILMAAYSANISQQKSYYAQDQVAEMQQNIRAAMALVTSDVRMAGYDPTDSGNFKISVLETQRLEMTADVDENGVISAASGETINYTLDNPTGEFRRQVDAQAAADAAIAKNIQDVEFIYLDKDGNITGNAADIRRVQFTILVRAGRPDREFTNTAVYTAPPPSNRTWGPFNDNFRRRLLTTSIRCRNLGL
ncbi:MAG: prepilin-type N-terminal cleavage/methylation domain-containing protein [Desulfobacter sp.]|nr:MAG: prepilin-type N-terminal cleavage/methylation domain-containing protein [Desulfobacter sp.]